MERESRVTRRIRDTRKRILSAALDLFSERGVDAVTVEEIAERADVARGTVFNHFSTKESLCQGLGELQAEMLLEAVQTGRIQAPTSGEKIEQALRLLAELPGQDPEQCRAILTRVMATAKPGELPEHRRKVFAVLEGWAAEGQATGEFRSDLPPCQLACFIMGLQLQATMVWAYGLTEGSLADNVSRVLRLGLEGMQVRE